MPLDVPCCQCSMFLFDITAGIVGVNADMAGPQVVCQDKLNWNDIHDMANDCVLK